MVRLLGEWGQHWFRTDYGKDEIDVGADVGHAPVGQAGGLSVGARVRPLRISELPESKRRWWLVSDGSEVDLCPTDPGFDVDLLVTTDLKTLAQVVLGDLSVRSALDDGKSSSMALARFAIASSNGSGCSEFADIKVAKRAADTRVTRLVENVIAISAEALRIPSSRNERFFDANRAVQINSIRSLSIAGCGTAPRCR